MFAYLFPIYFFIFCFTFEQLAAGIACCGLMDAFGFKCHSTWPAAAPAVFLVGMASCHAFLASGHVAWLVRAAVTLAPVTVWPVVNNNKVNNVIVHFVLLSLLSIFWHVLRSCWHLLVLFSVFLYSCALYFVLTPHCVFGGFCHVCPF